MKADGRSNERGGFTRAGECSRLSLSGKVRTSAINQLASYGQRAIGRETFGERSVCFFPARVNSPVGLYHWLGDDGIRAAFQERDPELSPDGFGRYLTADAEIGFHLEWDSGTERPQRLRAKARAAQAAVRGHVL